MSSSNFIIIVTIFSILVPDSLQREFRQGPDGKYQLTLQERAFLEDVLKFDEMIMERKQRGIVDQIFNTINTISTGVTSVVAGAQANIASGNPGGTVNSVGSFVLAPVAAVASPTNVQPAAAATGGGGGFDALSSINRIINWSNGGSLLATPPNQVQAAAATPVASNPGGGSGLLGSSGGGNSGGGLANLGGLGNAITSSGGGRNITGIVDEALKIGTPAPIRELVNGILSVAYCSGSRRLLGRC